jgi:two-component system LytT family response regulator
MKVTALIVDDEPLARIHLQDLIGAVPWLTCVGEAVDGESAIRSIDSLRPELIFLDIEMPGPSGLAVLERIRHRPAVIFTTAFDRYAVTAFEVSALDYLLKPFGEARFEAAVERARRTFDTGQWPATIERARSALAEPGAMARIFVRQRGRIMPISLVDVDRLEAQDDYVVVHVGGRQHLVRVPLGELVRRLDPERFVRVHRCHVVNIERVVAIAPHGDGRLDVRLRDGTVLTASRSKSRELRGLARGL